MDVVSFVPAHLPGVLALCIAEGWPTYPADPTRVEATFRAPGTITLVAVDEGEVIAFAHALTNGLRLYLAKIATAAHRRREGIARQLIDELFLRGGVTRIDLITDTAAEFYATFPHRIFTGVRLYPDNRR
jgi:GNAT superfamily N-acetyltransferase